MPSISIRKRPSVEEEKAASTFQFYRKSARGKVQKLVRETYYRDDIPCGSNECSLCGPLMYRNETAGSSLAPRQPTLEKQGIQNTYLGSPHYVIVDTNIVLHQMDMLESAVFTNVIILQTVAIETRNRSLPLYNRLRALMNDPDRHFWLFYNDFHAETCVARDTTETPNDRNDSAIRCATAWYGKHLGCQDTGLDVVLVSDDVANVHKARKASLHACNMREYITGFAVAEQLQELMSARTLETERHPELQRGLQVYEEYWAATQLEAAARVGTLHKGHFNASAYNFLEGSVRIEKFSEPVLLLGREAMNRAVDGDVVYVALLPESEWKGSTNTVLESDVAQRNDDARNSDVEEEESDDFDGADNTLRFAESNVHKKQPTGRVVGVARRHWRSYVAHIENSSVNESSVGTRSMQTVFASPVNRRIPRIKIRTRQIGALLGQKILVAMDEWRATSRYPEGHFIRALGAAETKEAEQESLLLEYDVPYRPFSKSILACLPPEGDQWAVPPYDPNNAVWCNRKDLREENICSIDPPGCQDIDDALHAKELPNGNIQVGVHIADVSHFVSADTPMDAEAASRGTTVYLVDKRIDMLPHLLGTNLCSLRPFVERLAFSVVWEVTPDAEIVHTAFFKSVIASKAAFTYEEAQTRKDDASLNDAITKSIRLLNTLAIKLKQRRMENGALNLASPEVRIHLDSAESSGPIDVEQKEMRETNSLVEEFMLLANTNVARRIYEAFPTTAVLRRHMPPPSENFEVLQDILQKRRGMELDVASSGALADSLDRCVDPKDPAFNTLVRILATRCMLSAEYFCTGNVARNAFGHYGLAMDMYTHFTSPIRRYADVLVHRQLAAAIQVAPLPSELYRKQYVENTLDVVNRRHRAGQMAGRASVEFYVGLAIMARNAECGANATEVGKADKTAQPLLRADAYIVRTFRNGVAVFVNQYGLEDLITFKQDCEFDSSTYQVTVPKHISGLATDLTLGIFDRCTVEIGVEKDKNTKRGRTKMALVL